MSAGASCFTRVRPLCKVVMFMFAQAYALEFALPARTHSPSARHHAHAFASSQNLDSNFDTMEKDQFMGVDFRYAQLAKNNLGGKGPDDGDEKMVFLNVSVLKGKSINLEIESLTDYSGNEDVNRMKGAFGQIHIFLDTNAKLRFTFVNNATNLPVVLPRFSFSFWDLDHGLLKGWERLTITPIVGYTLFQGSQVAAQRVDDATWSFLGREVGTPIDNPNDIDDLTLLQLKRGVEVDLASTSFFEVTLLASTLKPPMVPVTLPASELLVEHNKKSSSTSSGRSIDRNTRSLMPKHKVVKMPTRALTSQASQNLFSKTVAKPINRLGKKPAKSVTSKPVNKRLMNLRKRPTGRKPIDSVISKPVNKHMTKLRKRPMRRKPTHSVISKFVNKHMMNLRKRAMGRKSTNSVISKFANKHMMNLRKRRMALIDSGRGQKSARASLFKKGRTFMFSGFSKLAKKGIKHPAGPCLVNLPLNFSRPRGGELRPGSEGLRFGGVAHVEPVGGVEVATSVPVDLVLTVDDAYKAFNPAQNGGRGNLIQVNLADNVTTDLTFTFVNQLTGKPLPLSFFFLSVLDLDGTRIGYESVSVKTDSFAQYFVVPNSAVAIQKVGNSTTFDSTVYGNETTNPTNSRNLDDDQRKKGFALYFNKLTSQVTLTLSTVGAWTGRNFLFTGVTDIACPDLPLIPKIVDLA